MRKKVGLALGAGSAKGMAHIGVLKVFEENNICIDRIAGTSVGSLIGAIYASGMTSHQMADFVKGVKWDKLLDFSHPQSGLIRGKKVENLVRKIIGNKKFKDLDVPFSCVAVDIKSGDKIVFEDGDVAKAVRASISIPAVFEPVKMGKMLLVDGGVLDPIPVDILKKKTKFTIAIDVSSNPAKYQKASSRVDKSHEFWKTDMFTKSMLAFRKYLKSSNLIPKTVVYFLKPKRIKKYLTGSYVPLAIKVLNTSNTLIYNEMSKLKLQVSKPDILIHPNIDSVGMFDFDRHKFCIEKGENAARRAIPEIKRKLKLR